MTKTAKTSNYKNLVLASSAVAGITGCGQETINEGVKTTPINTGVAWAVNVGGQEYVGTDGITYQADSTLIDGKIGSIDIIKGSQDSVLFKTYREGEIAIEQPLNNGLYEIMFKFAEPEDIPVGDRVFDVYVQNKLVIADLDVRLARDGKHQSSLVRAINQVEVTDGKLNIALKSQKGTPILSAIVVRESASTMAEYNPDWQLVWSDEFDYEGKPNPEKWSYDIWPVAKVNEEDQTYTDRLENVYVKDGKLHITALREDFNDAKYTSGRIHSQGKGDFLYGRAEIKAKLPKGQGSWAAIWMLPSDPYRYSTTCKPNEDWQGSATCDAWPNSGEIDIMEHVGYDMQTIHGTVHNEAYYWAKWEQRKAAFEGVNVDSEFHVYSLEWTPESITIFFDDTPYFHYINEGEGWRSWPYDHPYHIILNLAVGGMWGRAGGPINDSIFPATMEVDYVRIYQSKNHN